MKAYLVLFPAAFAFLNKISHYGAFGANTFVPIAKVQVTVRQLNFDFTIPPFMPHLPPLIQEVSGSNPNTAKFFVSTKLQEY